MYIYEIMESRQVDDDMVFYSEYIVHENQFSEEEFGNICEMARMKSSEKNAYQLKEYLITVCGFKDLPVVQRFHLYEE